MIIWPQIACRTLHPAFRDFLLDKERVLGGREENTCGFSGSLHPPYVWQAKKRYLRAMLTRCICQWGSRWLDKAASTWRSSVRIPVLGAASSEERTPTSWQWSSAWVLAESKHLLHWLEALSLIRQTSEGVLLIILLEGLVKVSGLSILGRWQLTCSY